MRRTSSPVEVLQTTALDCGPAALTSLLTGLGVPADYAALRDLCGTDIDGTSIDDLEEVGQALGGDLEQIVTPIEQALAAPEQHLPAIVVTALPDGFLHFVVVWRKCGPFLQIMDPGVGRSWVRSRSFGRNAYRHQALVDSEAWGEWVSSADFLDPLRWRLQRLGLSQTEIDQLVDCKDPRPEAIARVEAACRATESVQREVRAPRRGTRRLLHALADPQSDALADTFWSARPAPGGQTTLRGAVLLRAVGTIEATAPVPKAAEADRRKRPLTCALVGAARQAPGLAAVALSAALTTAAMEVGLFFALQPLIEGRAHNMISTLALLILAATAAGVGYGASARMGRVMEADLRAGVRHAVPRLPDAYFRTRPASDTVERVHLVHRIAELPGHAWRILVAGTQMAIAVGALLVLSKGAWLLVLLLAAVSVAVPLAIAPVLAERDLRVRTHAGTLSHYLIDGLLGATALRAHRGAPAFRARHEESLVDWRSAARSLARTSSLYVLLADGLGFGVAGLLLYIGTSGLSVGSALVLAVLALGIPVLGSDLGISVRAASTYRSLLARLSDPLSAHLEPDPATCHGSAAVAIGLDQVSANLGGVPTVREVSVNLPAGAHVAIVGPSGAGKSTLLGMLLGWIEPSAGRIVLDGSKADVANLVALRRQTAWISPAVALWDRSLAENLSCGDPGAPDVAADPELADVQSRVGGLHGQTLGTGGSRLSGGQGQRVRIARGMGCATPRLVVLDEPCRGLEAETRSRLLTDMRRKWSGTTLLCVTHDIEETRSFPRVLVLDGGKLVEDGSPEELLSLPGSRYAELVADQHNTASRTWGNSRWRHVQIDNGMLVRAAAAEQDC